jgi:hypothetical protein
MAIQAAKKPCTVATTIIAREIRTLKVNGSMTTPQPMGIREKMLNGAAEKLKLESQLFGSAERMAADKRGFLRINADKKTMPSKSSNLKADSLVRKKEWPRINADFTDKRG